MCEARVRRVHRRKGEKGKRTASTAARTALHHFTVSLAPSPRHTSAAKSSMITSGPGRSASPGFDAEAEGEGRSRATREA